MFDLRSTRSIPSLIPFAEPPRSAAYTRKADFQKPAKFPLDTAKARSPNTPNGE
jgi:hypothetical protein